LNMNNLLLLLLLRERDTHIRTHTNTHGPERETNLETQRHIHTETKRHIHTRLGPQGVAKGYLLLLSVFWVPTSQMLSLGFSV
jgi:hypothetical protein